MNRPAVSPGGDNNSGPEGSGGRGTMGNGTEGPRAAHVCGLTPAQYGALLVPIPPGRVRKLDGASHVEIWDVRRYMNRIFGFTGWGSDVTRLEVAAEYQRPDTKRWVVCYRATVRLLVFCPGCGATLTSHEDTAAGSGAPQPRAEDAHDFAIKTAVSGAFKRAATNLGDQFGLSLYNDGSTDPVVGMTLAPPEGWAPANQLPVLGALPADETVTGGELDQVAVPSIAEQAQEESDQYADAADRGELDPDHEAAPYLGPGPYQEAPIPQPRRDDLAPEDRAADGGPPVPPPSAEGAIRDAFPEAVQVDPEGMARRVASVKAMAKRAASTDTLKRLYDGIVVDVGSCTAEERSDLVAAFREGFTRITGGQELPPALAHGLLGGPE